MLDSAPGVVRALLTYTDWWQPTTASILKAGTSRRTNEHRDGLREGLLDTLDERTELCRRMSFLNDRDRAVLFLWYVRQSSVAEIASQAGISRRQCFRVRSRAVQTLVKLGEPEEAA